MYADSVPLAHCAMYKIQLHYAVFFSLHRIEDSIPCCSGVARGGYGGVMGGLWGRSAPGGKIEAIPKNLES